MAQVMRTFSMNSSKLAIFRQMGLPVLCFTLLLFLIFGLTGCHHEYTGLLNPKGLIAQEQKKLFFDSLALMLIVVLPVIIMSIAFVYHYQVSHKIRDYKPNWSHNVYLESLWWGIPCVIILVLATLSWKKTHQLDPYQPIPGQHEQPLKIQVIALPWKWLFIYPEQKIASVNYLEVPVGREIDLVITADNVPMSAFSVPQLGGQIYAMVGMQTRLHLIAAETGVLDGLCTQYNGNGFADMHFPTHVVTSKELEDWFTQTKQTQESLTQQNYEQLVQPSLENKPIFYTSADPKLFDQVIMTYMSSVGGKHPRDPQNHAEKE